MRKIFILGLLLLRLGAGAQENYEIQVYSSPTMTRGQTIFELHSNYTFRGEKNMIKGIVPSYHSLHETVEITHGITDNFELGFYLFTNYSPGHGWKVIGTHIRPRIAAPQKWNLPIGLSLSAEIGWQHQAYSEETSNVEIRPIIDKTFGRWYLSLNPTLGICLGGVDNTAAPAFAPNFKTSYAVTPTWSIGAEYYGDLGPLDNFETLPQQNHSLFIVADIYSNPKWEINFGPGFGLTKATDGLVMKLLLGRRINWKKSK